MDPDKNIPAEGNSEPFEPVDDIDEQAGPPHALREAILRRILERVSADPQGGSNADKKPETP